MSIYSHLLRNITLSCLNHCANRQWGTLAEISSGSHLESFSSSALHISFPQRIKILLLSPASGERNREKENILRLMTVILPTLSKAVCSPGWWQDHSLGWMNFVLAAWGWRGLGRTKAWWGFSVEADEVWGSLLPADDSAWAEAFLQWNFLRWEPKTGWISQLYPRWGSLPTDTDLGQHPLLSCFLSQLHVTTQAQSPGLAGKQPPKELIGFISTLE